MEGPDLVGKTTLATALSLRWGVPVVHPWMDLHNAKASAKTLAKTLTPLLSACSVNVIFDRLYFSEYIYGQVLGRDTSYLPELFALTGSWQNLLLVVLDAHPDLLTARYREHSDWYLTLDQVLLAATLYPSLLDIVPLSIPRLLLNTSTLSVEECVSRVETYALSSLPTGSVTCIPF